LTDHRIRKNLGTSDWVLKYFETFETRAEAMKRELEIKSKKRRSYLETLIKKENELD
jgi:putative endonuclease